MERAVAIKKLGKILGKSLGYRVDPKAPDQDDRDEAHAKLREETPKRDALKKQMEARRAEVLLADTEYQRLKTDHARAAKNCDDLFSITYRYRFTAGTSNGMFFRIEAQGDSWEDVIAELTEKATAS
jgi:hypothetical protein